MVLQMGDKQIHVVPFHMEEVKMVTLFKEKKKKLPLAAKIPKPFTTLLAWAIEGSTQKNLHSNLMTPLSNQNFWHMEDYSH